MRGYLLAIAAVVIASVGQIVLKLGISKESSTFKNSIDTASEFIQVMIQPMVIGGLFLYALSALMWLVVLSELDVSKAYPILGLSYVLVLFLSVVVIGEELTLFKSAGTVLVISGVVLIGLD